MTDKVLWITSFNKEIYKVSGTQLILTFINSKTEGDFFIGTEGGSYLKSKDRFTIKKLDNSTILKNWLEVNKDIIPVNLGGNALPCNCSKPFAKAERKHKTPDCHHTWFNRNASRWFRKALTLNYALLVGLDKLYQYFIWIDADCIFKKQITKQFIANNLFKFDTVNEYDVVGLKSSRKVMEAGLVGYNIACNSFYKNTLCHKSGYQLLIDIMKCYQTGRFRGWYRWDDSYIIQKMIKHGNYRFHDIATKVNRMQHSDVFEHSLIGEYLTHNKGKHGRELGIMK